MFRTLTIALLTTLLSTAALAQGPEAKTSERTAPATYRAESGGTTVLVDAYLASLRLEDDYLPLHVAIGVPGRGERTLVTRESLTLIDARGNTYPLASQREIAESYGKVRFDRALLRIHPMAVGNQFAASTRVPARFFPEASARALLRDKVEIGPFAWFNDVFYFPRPELLLPGEILILRVENAEGLPPVEVQFQLPS